MPRRLDYLVDHALASALAGRALAGRGTASTRPRPGRGSTTSRAPLTLRANRCASTRDELAERARAATASRPSRARFAPDGLIVDARQSAADAARRRRTRSSSRTRRRSSSRARRRRAPGERVLDACASPGGKTRRWRPAWTTRACSSPPTSAAGACDCWREPSRAAGAPHVRVVQADAAQAAAVRRDLRSACSSTRRARASARCAAIPTSGGAAPTDDFAALGGAAARAAATAPPRSSRQAAASSTRPARASRRRTKPSSTRSSVGSPDFRAGRRSQLCRAAPRAHRLGAATCGRCHFATAWKRSSPRAAGQSRLTCS